VRLVDLTQRKKDEHGTSSTQFEVMSAGRKIMRTYPDLRSSVQIPQAI